MDQYFINSWDLLVLVLLTMQCSTFIFDVADCSTNYIKIKWKIKRHRSNAVFFLSIFASARIQLLHQRKNMQWKHAKEKDFTFLYQYRAPLNERNKFWEGVTTCEWLNILLAKYICACKICSIHPTHSVCQQLHTLLIYTFWKAIGSYHTSQYGTLFIGNVKGKLIKIITKLFMLFVL